MHDWYPRFHYTVSSRHLTALCDFSAPGVKSTGAGMTLIMVKSAGEKFVRFTVTILKDHGNLTILRALR